jgi:MFS family permease
MYNLVLHHIHSHRRFRRANEIYASLSIKAFALSLVSIFIPIYLYKLGYSIQTILWFFIADFCMRAVLFLVAGPYVARFGPKHGLFISSCAAVAQLVLFFTLPTYHWSILVLAFSSALTATFHFLSYYVDFAAVQNKKNVAKQVGILMQLLLIATSIGPLIGGLIGTYFGLHISLVVASVLALLSFIPLLASREPRIRHQYALTRLPFREITPDLISSAANGFHMRTSSQLWPFALFLVVLSYAKVGLLSMVSLILILSISHIVIGKADAHRRKLLKIGAWGSAAVHVSRAVVHSFGGAVIVNLFDGILNWFCVMPWHAEMYDRARKFSIIPYLVAFEVAGQLSSALYWAIMLGLSYVFSLEHLFVAGFILGALGTLQIPAIMKRRTAV